MKIKTIIRKDNFLATIKSKPTRIIDDKLKKMGVNAVANLYLSMVDSVYVVKQKAKETWNALVKLYEVKSFHNRMFLKRRQYNL